VLVRPSSVAWQFSGLTCLLAAVGYIVTRSVRVPGDMGDRGNWLEPHGLTALFTEGIVPILALLVLVSMPRRPKARRRQRPR